MSRDGGTLESLQNVDQNLLHKLKGVGIVSISDLATIKLVRGQDNSHSLMIK